MFRLRILDIYIAKKFGLLFVGTFFICQFVLMMQFLWRAVDDLIGKGLSLDVLAQFFWYMGLMLMPQAFPLAILLSSLITFGNLGESSELTAIKSAGISLMQAFRSLIVIVSLMTCCSFVFQNYVGPEAYKSFNRLLLSMKQASPELEIPEGIFYNGIPGTNLYVEKKDLKTGRLYGVIIYRIEGGYEDAAIIVADSGMLQSTAEKKHLLLTLYSGEWFENMKSRDVGGKANIPYRRETFTEKQILLDFDGEFNLAEVAGISASAGAKSLGRILNDLDSIKLFNDSVGRDYYEMSKRTARYRMEMNSRDSVRLTEMIAGQLPDIDSIYKAMPAEKRQQVVKTAVSRVHSHSSELDMRSDYTKGLHKTYRRHWIEAITKFTLSLSCLIFFFIGAPLGAIIRKGGLGVPVIISVFVFIVYYLLDSTGMKMSRDGHWVVAFGMLLSTMVLAPLAYFFTYKANHDSTLFNIEVYRGILFAIIGIRVKRHVAGKEVVIDDPQYEHDAHCLAQISADIEDYSQRHSLLHAPNPITVFFHAGDDHRIQQINDELETVIADLSNSRDRKLLAILNNYPIIATHAHTRPFKRKWINILAGLLIPVGLFFYLRMCRYRLQLYHDLKTIKTTSDKVTARIEEGLREREERLRQQDEGGHTTHV